MHIIHTVRGLDIDPRYANGLRMKAANVACGSDTQQWVKRGAVSNALAAAADALAEGCRAESR